MKKKIIFASILTGLMVFSTAGAADIIAPDGGNPNVSIPASETRRNVYTAGSSVTVSGNIQGDLVAAGGMITVDGPVEQDVLIAGGSLNLNGTIGGDARIAGGNITVAGTVGGDLVVGGGNVSITSRSSVGGDLVAGGGNLIIDAPVNGTARLGGGNVTINNRINGDVYANTGQRLVFGPQAVVTGTVYYKGPQEAVIQPGAQVGNIQYTPYQPGQEGKRAGGIATAAFLINLAASLIVGFILLGLMRGSLPRLAEETFRRPWVHLGIGLIGLIVVPIVAVLLLLTVIGYYAAIILGLSYVLLLMLANVLAGIALGYLVLGWIIKPRERIAPWQAVLAGLVIWSLLGLIPVVGWIIMVIVFLMMLGTLLRLGWNRLAART